MFKSFVTFVVNYRMDLMLFFFLNSVTGLYRWEAFISPIFLEIEATENKTESVMVHEFILKI